jgi:energy-coupling factor transporter ATP-binding protein EcfA2
VEKRSEFSAAPYPGLRPFRPDEADIYFGREPQIDALLGRLQRTRFLAVIGPSGCGKSSLVRAGMIPALETGFMVEAGANWRIVTMTPGDHPMARLADRLADSRALGSGRNNSATALTAAALRSGPRGLIEVVRDARLPAGTNLLLVVDQFEEIFRYWEKGDRDEADAFVSLLLASTAQSDLSIYVVTTMRSDFLGECAMFRGLPEAMNDSQYLTPRITREQCGLAITGPARVFGGTVEPLLVNRLLNDFGPDPDQLPLLQHALMRMWERAQSRARESSASPRLGLKDYEALGGLARALSDHADEVLRELSPKQQAIAEVMFRSLTERGMGKRDTRSPALLSDVAAVAGVAPDAVHPVVEAFRRPDRSFIVPAAGTPLAPNTLLDIGHESLIRQWRTLAEWVEREARSAALYQRLRVTAQLWRRDEEALLRNPGLERALEWEKQERPTEAWARRYGTPEEYRTALDFLRASEKAWNEEQEREREAAKREQEQKIALMTQEAEQQKLKAENAALRNHKRFLSSIAVLLPLLVIAAVWAAWQMNVAQKEAQAAREAEFQAWKANEAAQQAQKNAEADAKQYKDLLDRLSNPDQKAKRAFLTGNVEAIISLAATGANAGGFEFGARKSPLGSKTADGKQVFRYELFPAPESLRGPLATATQISYYMNHPTFQDRLLTAGPRNGFTASYQGWGCLTKVYVLIEYADPERPPDVTWYNMCDKLG